MKQSLTRAAFVIAGGRSSRMGTDKIFLKLAGKSMIARSLAIARSVCCEVSIVGDPAKFSDYGTVIKDLYPGAGPLAGIHAALHQSSWELNLMLAVDMPFVTEELLKFLFTTAEQTDALVTVPRMRGGFQPLCAVYRPAFAVPAEHSLREGKNKIDALFNIVPMRVIEENELNAAGFSAQLFRNLNTPEDLAEAQSEFLSS